VYDETSGDTVNLPQIEDDAKMVQQLRQDIKNSEAMLQHYQAKIMAQMGDAKVAHAGDYQVTWGEMNFKAVPEKIVPAKPARTVRNANLRIKYNG
jgi:predicted phage-related endonuclease